MNDSPLETDGSNENLIESLMHLLERERALLLKGQLDALAEIIPIKETLLDEIAARDRTAPEAQMVALRARIARNQALLDGALRGIRAVAARMSDLRQVRRGLDTYDQSGRRTTIESPGPSVERRA